VAASFLPETFGASFQIARSKTHFTARSARAPSDISTPIVIDAEASFVHSRSVSPDWVTSKYRDPDGG
jgi:hypothetical protein